MTERMFQDVYDVEESCVPHCRARRGATWLLTWDTRGLRATSGHRPWGAHTMTSGCGQDAMREQCRLAALGVV